MNRSVKRWVIARQEALAETLASALGLLPSFAQVLVNRGFRDTETAKRFLNPQLRQLRDPFELPNMEPAVRRIETAIADNQSIVIYGDYDVDGITASALLSCVLKAAGARVSNFLPLRRDEGYGLTDTGIARCIREHNPRLLIAVDCGTSSVSEIAGLRARGVDTVILDHHEPPAKLPDCAALVNPKLGEHGEPLASVGVVFKLAHALLKSNRQWNIDLRDHLDLVATGTVADIVPLTGDNRILVKSGLERMSNGKRVGLRALMDIAGVSGRVSPYHIGFRIGPRLNAAGRLADARAALELLLTEDAVRAGELAGLLDAHNAERQRVEEKILEQALVQAGRFASDRVLVLAGEDWHPGVIGIVASRVAKEFHRPALIIGAGGKGSCRSVAGFNMVQALATCASLLKGFGGHEMAAGLTVEYDNLPALRNRLNDLAGELPAPELAIEAVVGLDDLDDEFLSELEKIEPCGVGNPQPVFAACRVGLRGAPRVLKGKHLKFYVTDGETGHEAIWWNAGGQSLPTGLMDVAFVPEVNEYQGGQSVQLNVRDIRPSHSAIE